MIFICFLCLPFSSSFDFQLFFVDPGIRDTNLKLTLAFGVGIHHAGLHEKDRAVVEELFLNQKTQVCGVGGVGGGGGGGGGEEVSRKGKGEDRQKRRRRRRSIGKSSMRISYYYA